MLSSLSCLCAHKCITSAQCIGYSLIYYAYLRTLTNFWPVCVFSVQWVVYYSSICWPCYSTQADCMWEFINLGETLHHLHNIKMLQWCVNYLLMPSMMLHKQLNLFINILMTPDNKLVDGQYQFSITKVNWGKSDIYVIRQYNLIKNIPYAYIHMLDNSISKIKETWMC